MLRHELNRLKHKDVRQRRMAVRRLFEINDPAALAAFIELLDDDDEWFVEKSVDAMRRWIGPEHRKIIVSLSVRKEARLRHLAAELAPQLGAEALSILSTLCEDNDQSVCREGWSARLSVDPGTIPVAIENPDYIVRKMAISHSGDTTILEKMLQDDNLHVQESALKQMISIGHHSSSMMQLLDGPLQLKAAEICFPMMIESEDVESISSLCTNPTPALRKIIAKHLDSVDWFQWDDVVTATKSSSDLLLLPRLLRSRREPEADVTRYELLQSGDDTSRLRVLEHLHGRPISKSIFELLADLSQDSNPLIAQAAESLMVDSETLEMGA